MRREVTAATLREQDLLGAGQLVSRRLVDPRRFLELVRQLPDSAYARYPNLSPPSVLTAVEEFLSRAEA